MAHRIEKVNGEYEIVIDGFSDGTSANPYTGMHRMFQVNLSVPGEVSVGFPITASTTSGATLGTPIARSTAFFNTYGTAVPADSVPTKYAILDTNSRVWEATSLTGTWTFLSSSNTTTGGGDKDGIAYWCGFLIKTRQSSGIDFWNGSTWASVAGSPTLSAAVKHFCYVGDDNVLYITNGPYVASFELDDPTDPNGLDLSNTATFTFNATTLQLSITDQAQSLCDVGSGGASGSTLLIGGSQNYIYPWDKVSPSFDKPIYVAEPFIFNLVSANQNAFVFAGGNNVSNNAVSNGTIYITNGSQAEEWFHMPDYIFAVQTPRYVWGDAIFHRNQLLFGCLIKDNSGTTKNFAEIFSVDFKTKRFCSVSSLGITKGNAKCLLSVDPINNPGWNFLVGWTDDASTPGIGRSSTNSGIGTSTIYTDYMNVGSFLQKKTFTQIEYKLRTVLESGENIRVVAAPDNDAQQLTFIPTPTTGVISGVAPVNFQGSQWLQLIIELTGNSQTSGVRLSEIRIR